MSRYAFITCGKSTREVKKRIRDESVPGFFRTENVGKEAYEYRVEFDEDRMQQMAHEAAKNKRGYSVDGALKVTITKRDLTPAEVKDPRTVCPNCGQWQNDNLRGGVDCLNRCVQRGLA